jgi:hypothetical protein
MKIYRYPIISLAVIIVILLNSCERFNCIEGNNIFAIEERPTGYFSGIELDGYFDVYVNYDSVTSVTVEGDENLLRFITTYTKGNTLEIGTSSRRCLDSWHPIVITVNTPVLDHINLEGSGNIDCSYFNIPYLDIRLDGSGYIYVDVDCDELNADIDGSGEIRLVGSCFTSYLKIDGSGRIRAFDFESEECYVDIYGSGDVYVFVWDILDVYIDGSGIVYYEGNPVIRERIEGTGDVRRR